MKTNKKFLGLSLGVALAGLAAGALVPLATRDAGRMAHAAWAFQTDRLPELAKHADTIVVATAHKEYFSKLAYSTDPGDALPFQVIEFTVEQGLKGAAAGQTIFVERAGGDDLDGVHHEIDIDGGEFTLGATYVLFLKQQPDGAYLYQINDQARFQVASDTLVTEEDGAIVRTLAGNSLAQATAAISQALGQ